MGEGVEAAEASIFFVALRRGRHTSPEDRDALGRDAFILDESTETTVARDADGARSDLDALTSASSDKSRSQRPQVRYAVLSPGGERTHRAEITELFFLHAWSIQHVR